MNAQGQADAFQVGLNPQDIDIVPAHENLYAVDPASRNVAWAPPRGRSTGIIGDILVTQESPGLISRVRWDGTAFVVTGLAEAAGLKQVAFSPAGVGPIAAVTQVYDKIAVVRHAPLAQQRARRGHAVATLGEETLLNGNDVITSDLLVPGTPHVTAAPRPTSAARSRAPRAPQPDELHGDDQRQRLAAPRRDADHSDRVAGPVASPPAPQGTRDVSLSKASETFGDAATLRNLFALGQSRCRSPCRPAHTDGSRQRAQHGLRLRRRWLDRADRLQPRRAVAQRRQRVASCRPRHADGEEQRHAQRLDGRRGDDPSCLRAGIAARPSGRGGESQRQRSALRHRARAARGDHHHGNGRLRGTVACDLLRWTATASSRSRRTTSRRRPSTARRPRTPAPTTPSRSRPTRGPRRLGHRRRPARGQHALGHLDEGLRPRRRHLRRRAQRGHLGHLRRARASTCSSSPPPTGS